MFPHLHHSSLKLIYLLSLQPPQIRKNILVGGVGVGGGTVGVGDKIERGFIELDGEGGPREGEGRREGVMELGVGEEDGDTAEEEGVKEALGVGRVTGGA